MPKIKTMTVDDFYTKEQANNLKFVVQDLSYTTTDLGKQIDQFNHVPENINDIFETVFPTSISTYMDDSGVFRSPSSFIHFEGFDTTDDWMFAVALDQTTFNVFEHKSGATTALDGYRHNYNNLFDWDLTVNYTLKPGQGVFFRPWLFHSFHSGVIQLFRFKENDNRI